MQNGATVDAVTPRIVISDFLLPSGALAVTVSGDLDFGTAPVFRQRIRAILEDRCEGRLELDFTFLDFCDIAGMRAIHEVAEAATGMQHQTWITAAAPSLDTVLQLCEITAFLGYSVSQKEG
jgi:anti-anti-sigma factor